MLYSQSLLNLPEGRPGELLYTLATEHSEVYRYLIWVFSANALFQEAAEDGILTPVELAELEGLQNRFRFLASSSFDVRSAVQRFSKTCRVAGWHVLHIWTTPATTKPQSLLVVALRCAALVPHPQLQRLLDRSAPEL